MKTYIKFLILNFLKSFLYTSTIFFSLIFIINLLSELDFFKNIEVKSFFTIYLALINSPSLTFEIFPFVILISTQFFFINLFNNNELQIFKYSGLKNTKILSIITVTSFCVGIFIILIFYNFSSNLKNIYLETKSNYTNDGKYLAVITKNGLWIKDKFNNKNLIINSNKLKSNYLLDTFITELNENFESIRNIKSEKIDIANKKWIVYEPVIFEKNTKNTKELLHLETNFDYSRIQSLFSNLSSLSFFKLIELKENYKSLNYSIVEINVQIQKLISFPFYLSLMTMLSATIMFNTKKFKNIGIKITIGFLLSVIIYYLNNFFNVLGITEKITYIWAVWSPILVLLMINFYATRNVNEK